MLQIDDKDFIPLRFYESMCMRRHFRPAHEKFRIYFNDKPAWSFRGILFDHNKRRKPRILKRSMR